MWALGHQHLCMGAEIKSDLAGRCAAQCPHGPSPLPLCVLLCTHACVFLKGISRGKDTSLSQTGDGTHTCSSMSVKPAFGCAGLYV